jgi:hypothetical protein
MEDQGLILSVIKEKFPHQQKRIDELYEQDQDFQALCADYLLCLNAVKLFNLIYHEQGKSIEEFEAMIKDLEKELYEFICA